MSLLSCASRETLQRGREDYEAGRVERLARLSDGCSTGILLDACGSRYVTTIDPVHPRRSLCTCPHAENPRIVCRHMVALFYAVSPHTEAR